jgi:ankyrin repeat protein
MIALIRTALSLPVLAIIAFPINSANAAVGIEQRSKAPRSSNSAVQNRSKIRELINAAVDGNLEKVAEILNTGVNVNATYERDNSELSGMTALMVASSHGYSNMVGELIKRGANVNLKRYGGGSALMLAAGNPDVQTIKALLAAGANPNIQEVSFHAGEITPLILVINSQNEHRLEIAEMLIAARAEINPRRRFMLSPLMHATTDLEMVKLLVSYGADVNQRNVRGSTPLMAAATDGPPSVVRYLLEKGADANARDQEGYTALVYAENRHEILEPAQQEEIIQILRRLAPAKALRR